jgi:hypothetical protein
VRQVGYLQEMNPDPRSTKHHHHHHHKPQGMAPLIRSVPRVITAAPNVAPVFHLFSFLVVCSDMISKGFGLVAFFASVKASFVCIQNIKFPKNR